MFRDPIVQEVRNTRKKIEAEHGHDFEKNYKAMLQFQKGLKNPPVSLHKQSK